MKKVRADNYEEEVDKWKLEVIEETSHMTKEEKEEFLKLEVERIRKEYNFKFLEEKEEEE